MNKYLTTRNVMLMVLAVSAVVFIAVLFSGRKPVKDNSTAIEILTRELHTLQADQARARQADSIQWADYQESKRADSLILRTFKKLSDEKIIHISNADNNELRRLLSE